MTDEERERIKKLLRDHTKRVCQSPETARRSLIDSGIYTEDGELAPEYGGPERKSE